MRLFVVLLSLFLCSCANTDGTRNITLNQQMVERANEVLDKSVSRKILVIKTKWPTDHFFIEHRFLIIKTNGHLYAYDQTGTQNLKGLDEDPMVIADQITTYAVTAYYETIIK